MIFRILSTGSGLKGFRAINRTGRIPFDWLRKIVSKPNNFISKSFLSNTSFLLEGLFLPPKEPETYFWCFKKKSAKVLCISVFLTRILASDPCQQQNPTPPPKKKPFGGTHGLGGVPKTPGTNLQEKQKQWGL